MFCVDYRIKNLKFKAIFILKYYFTLKQFEFHQADKISPKQAWAMNTNQRTNNEHSIASATQPKRMGK